MTKIAIAAFVPEGKPSSEVTIVSESLIVGWIEHQRVQLRT